jgi:hypothetical protein
MRHGEVVFLAAYLQKLVEWDARACVRMQQRGAFVGIFGAPPTGCVSFVALPLSSVEEASDGLRDRTVSAGRLRDIIGDVSRAPRGFAGREVRVPEPVTGPLELMNLPPSSGWKVTAEASASAALPGLEAAVADFSNRVGQPGSIPDSQAERIANEIWSRTGWGELPIRVLHTAARLGFLSNDEAVIRSASVDGWTRLATGPGQVFAHGSVDNLKLPLTVLR